jgi:hypothetical protein
MTVDRIVHLVAGTMILATLALSHYHHPYWVWVTAFIGLNLAQSSITNFCPLSSLLRKARVPDGSCC